MLVCHCRAVSDRTIKRAIDDGADTLDEIGELCGAGTCCAGCHPELERLLSERARRLAVAGAGHGLVGAVRAWRHG